MLNCIECNGGRIWTFLVLDDFDPNIVCVMGDLLDSACPECVWSCNYRSVAHFKIVVGKLSDCCCLTCSVDSDKHHHKRLTLGFLFFQHFCHGLARNVDDFLNRIPQGIICVFGNVVASFDFLSDKVFLYAFNNLVCNLHCNVSLKQFHFKLK